MVATGKTKKGAGIGGHKVGRLRMTIARAIGRRCADIYISDNHLKHIANAHSKELAQLGIGALENVKLVTASYNQIRQGSGTSLLLVIYSEEHHHTAAIDLNYSTKKGVWGMKTAQPRRNRDIDNRKLLWKK